MICCSLAGTLPVATALAHLIGGGALSSVDALVPDDMTGMHKAVMMDAQVRYRKKVLTTHGTCSVICKCVFNECMNERGKKRERK